MIYLPLEEAKLIYLAFSSDSVPNQISGILLTKQAGGREKAQSRVKRKSPVSRSYHYLP